MPRNRREPMELVGRVINHRITEEAYMLLGEEVAARRKRDAARTSVGSLITEAVMSYYGPIHRERVANQVQKRRSLLQRPASRKGAAA